jgi:hypothetical protein
VCEWRGEGRRGVVGGDCCGHIFFFSPFLDFLLFQVAFG